MLWTIGSRGNGLCKVNKTFALSGVPLSVVRTAGDGQLHLCGEALCSDPVVFSFLIRGAFCQDITKNNRGLQNGGFKRCVGKNGKLKQTVSCAEASCC